MTHLHAHRPTFAANIALVSQPVCYQLIQLSKADAVAQGGTDGWAITDDDQFLEKAASFTCEVRSCTSVTLSNKKTGKIGHLNPSDTTNQNALELYENATKDKLNLGSIIAKHLHDIKSAILVGGQAGHPQERENNLKAKKLSEKLLEIIQKYDIMPSFFLNHKKQLAVCYIGKNATSVPKSIQDTLFICTFDEAPPKSELRSYLNNYFGKWHVSKNDKLVWVNEHLDIHDPHFIEEIPRELYDTHA
ncbi:MAG: hypothetical protein QE263_06885 [Vampirovibrionales bacterium]|nr:hypothetical protein [Vampirovibrionales bacterium]